MASTSAELSALFARDLARLVRQLEAIDDAHLWRVAPGVTNSAGNLLLHLNGNLREYIGRQIGGVAYKRDRPREFAATGVPREELGAALGELVSLIPMILGRLTEQQWDNTYPEQVLGEPLTNRQFVVHLFGHFSYHLGQIDYIRRMLSGDGALPPPPPK
jgi:hypothetical protein